MNLDGQNHIKFSNFNNSNIYPYHQWCKNMRYHWGGIERYFKCSVPEFQSLNSDIVNVRFREHRTGTCGWKRRWRSERKQLYSMMRGYEALERSERRKTSPKWRCDNRLNPTVWRRRTDYDQRSPGRNDHPEPHHCRWNNKLSDSKSNIPHGDHPHIKHQFDHPCSWRTVHCIIKRQGLLIYLKEFRSLSYFRRELWM